jgi:hypothetical protein
MKFVKVKGICGISPLLNSSIPQHWGGGDKNNYRSSLITVGFKTPNRLAVRKYIIVT